ncbi:hypothetical protein [Chelativorans sp. AA-79]|uniref:hypothetical protein n=1 Tax=Chelativorans sp. AA-79 TaxID=3028735 RepID=UPI0023F63E5E|nr:hypothetical protein [Chelativorans sp. AA-79]WEX07851.1 hypothetical protein PVE73_17355 [Chelativorans sp. AA-79]
MTVGILAVVMIFFVGSGVFVVLSRARMVMASSVILVSMNVARGGWVETRGSLADVALKKCEHKENSDSQIRYNPFARRSGSLGLHDFQVPEIWMSDSRKYIKERSVLYSKKPSFCEMASRHAAMSFRPAHMPAH